VKVFPFFPFSFLASFSYFADFAQDSPLPPERGSNGAAAVGSTRASAWAGPSSHGWTNTNGPASTAAIAIGKPSLGRDPKSRARSRDYLKQYAPALKECFPVLIPLQMPARNTISYLAPSIKSTALAAACKQPYSPRLSPQCSVVRSDRLQYAATQTNV
jgi:hypothetical protein